MPSLPTGTVTFLFTDIEGSTRLVQHLGDARSEQIFADHRRLLRDAVEAAGGSVAEDQGESFLFVFQRARDAVLAAVTAQRALAAHPWPEGAAIRVRMGLHTGEPVSTGETYVGVDVHRVARICQAGHGGQVLLSQTTRGLVEEDLPGGVSLRDLGEHRLRDLAKPQRLFQVVVPNLPTDFPPLRSLDVLPNNLPIQLTSFIGREREIEEVKRLLSETRLLTLTGVGGVGKTRLALQIAAQVLDEFKDGVWLVELAPVADPALVPQTVASALGAREQPGRPIMTTLIDFLRSKQLLLALDNAEHLIEACAQLADTLLRGCPNMRILATSREALAIAGETMWRVPSLSLPDLQRLPPVEQLMEFEAIRLFVERARAVLPGFKLTNQNAAAVAQICHQLDGLPLAIELAAARVNLLSGEQIAARLNDRFRLLTGGGRTTVPRHQTLRAVIDWSYGLLSNQDRILLRRLSVFAGGWTLEAAEAVCTGEGLDGYEPLDLLTHLASKSLVVTEAQDEAHRYRLLETVRQYSREKLQESGEEAEARRKHFEWYLGLAELADRGLHGLSQAMWLDRLETDHDNLRAALEWCRARPDGSEELLSLAGRMLGFWTTRGYLTEGREWLEQALKTSKNPNTATHARALLGAGAIALAQGDMSRARACLEESLNTYRTLRDKRSIGNVVAVLGRTTMFQGDVSTAQALWEESLAVARELNDKEGTVASLNHLARVDIVHGNYDLARSKLEESLLVARESGNKDSIAFAASASGELARCEGDYTRAAAFYEEDLALGRELGNHSSITRALGNLGYVALHEGDLDQAARLFGEGLRECRRFGRIDRIAGYLWGLGGVAGAKGQGERGAVLFGAAQSLLEAITIVAMDPADQFEFDRGMASLRAALGETRFAEAWAGGRAMTLEQAIAYALSEEM